MSGTLHGVPEFHKRLNAFRDVFRGAGPAWQRATVEAAKPHIPVRTGATRTSVRPGFVSGTRAKVVGKYTMNFIDAGSKAHEEPRSRFTKTGRLRRGKAAGSGKVLKFQMGGQTMFRRKVNKPRIAARPFKKEAARKGLEKVDLLARLIDAWNKAA